MNEAPRHHRAGSVSILGLPNAGKSTLLNAFICEKLAIVSDKPQTTRTSLDGVLTLPDAQIVFVDTPGIHRSDTLINRRMMHAVRAALEQVDAILYVHDATSSVGEQEEQALDLVRKTGRPAVLALNKVDAVKNKHRLLEPLDRLQKLYSFHALIPVSAQNGEGLDTLLREVTSLLPAGPSIYPDDHLTNVPSRFLAAEMIREKVLNETRQEVPHSTAVLVEKWDETPRITRIQATIYVERPGQKSIVVGAKGEMIKRIGTAARLEMESFFDRRFHLDLFVKVRNDWRNQPEFLNELDWRRMTGNENS